MKKTRPVDPGVVHAASEAWLLARILLRFVAVAVLVWVAAIAISHGGFWYALAIPLGVVALLQLVLSSAILWSWAKELGGANGHS